MKTALFIIAALAACIVKTVRIVAIVALVLVALPFSMIGGLCVIACFVLLSPLLLLK